MASLSEFLQSRRFVGVRKNRHPSITRLLGRGVILELSFMEIHNRGREFCAAERATPRPSVAHRELQLVLSPAIIPVRGYLLRLWATRSLIRCEWGEKCDVRVAAMANRLKISYNRFPSGDFLGLGCVGVRNTPWERSPETAMHALALR